MGCVSYQRLGAEMPRVTGIVSAVMTAALVVLSAAAPATAVAKAPDVAAKKAMVTFFYDQLFYQGNLSVIDTYLGPVYIQHNPRLADGADALRQLIINGRNQNPNSHNTIERVTGQGDLVMIYHHSIPAPGALGAAIMDVFRVSKGKIVEHW